MQGALGGPVASLDNGDGTFTFQMPDGTSLRGAGPEAAAKHAQLTGGSQPPMQINPELAAAAAPRSDMRTAEKGSFDVPGLTVPNTPPPSATDAGGAPPPSPQMAAILSNLNATAGIPQTVKPKKAAGVDPSELVGVGGGPGAPGRNDQIPTVVTGGGGGGRVVPGHMQLAQTSTAQTRIPEAAQREFGQAIEEKGKANEQQTAADIEAARQMAWIKGNANKDLSAYGERMDDAEARRQAYLADRQQRVDAATERLKSIPDERAPSMGIGGAIAVALGALGQAFSRGPNTAMEIVNRKMDMAIAASRHNYEKAKGNVDAEKDGYAFAMKTIGDQRQAELAVKNRYLDDAARQLDAATANVQSPLIQARATAMRAALMQERAQNDAKFNAIEEHNSYVMTRPQGGGGPVYNHADIKKNETVKGDIDPRTGKPRYYEFGEGATAQDAQKRLEALNGDVEDARELQAIVANPANLLDPAMKKKADVISIRMIKRTKSADNTAGGMRKEAIEMLERGQGGDPNAYLSLGKSAGLAEYLAGVEREQKRIIEQHAISQIEPYREIDARTGKETMQYKRVGAAPQQAPNFSGQRVGE
jgi:hypothetical protein